MGAPRRQRLTVRAAGLGAGIWRPFNDGRLGPVLNTMADWTFVEIFRVRAIPANEVSWDAVNAGVSGFWSNVAAGIYRVVNTVTAVNAPRAIVAGDVDYVFRMITTCVGGTATVYQNRVPGTPVAGMTIVGGVPALQTVLQSGAFGSGQVVSMDIIDIALAPLGLTTAQVLRLDDEILAQGGVPAALPTGRWTMQLAADDIGIGANTQWRGRVSSVDLLRVGANSIITSVVPGSRETPWGKVA